MTKTNWQPKVGDKVWYVDLFPDGIPCVGSLIYDDRFVNDISICRTRTEAREKAKKIKEILNS